MSVEDDFIDALKGAPSANSVEQGAAGHTLTRRLGEWLRARHRRALTQMDDLSLQRTWSQIETRIRAADVQSIGGRFSRMRLVSSYGAAAALACVALGAVLGQLVLQRAPDWPQPSRLEFEFGELERSRGSQDSATVTVPDEAAAVRAITAALIHDAIAFELYSRAGSNDRLLLLVLPEPVPQTSGAVLQEWGAPLHPGRLLALTITRGS